VRLYLISFLILLIFTVPSSAEEITSEEITIESDSYELISFTVLGNITLGISGNSGGNLSLLVLDTVNYNNWLAQTSYIDKLNTSVSGDFDHEVIFENIFNDTDIRVLFINTQSQSIQLDYLMEIVSVQDDKAEFSPFFLVPLALIPFIRFRRH
jgi:hypothetical protein